MQSAFNSTQELLDIADFLEKEAATWSLVHRVVCREGFLDLGRLAPDGRMTFSQSVAYTINQDEDLLM